MSHLRDAQPAPTALGAAFVLALVASPAAAESLYTSIRRADCGAPPAALGRAFAEADLGVQECPAPPGWRLLFVASDANSWLEVRSDELAWSAEEAVVYDQPIGLFPNVGGAQVVEWRLDAQARPRALIFRVVAQDPEDPRARQVSRLLVVRLGAEAACLIGRAATNEAARSLADGPAACPPAADAARP